MIATGQKRARLRRMCLTALRVTPWVAFGPITGVMTERAIRCYSNGDRILAGLYVIANISVLISIPAVTAALALNL